MDINNVELIGNKETSCYYHRIKLPFESMHVKSKKHAPLCIFNRFPDFNLLTFRTMKKSGIKFIVDIDDSPFLSPHSPFYENSIKEYAVERQLEFIENADMVWTSTERLRDMLVRYNPNILVIPNSIPFGCKQFSGNTYFENCKGVIYTGSMSHEEDLSIIKGMEGLTFAGYKPGSYFDNIKNAFPECSFVKNKPLDRYMDAYDGMKISIAPLFYTAFNECKSNLKILEAGCKGIPIICSPITPYMGIEDKHYVLYARNRSEFEEWVNRLNNDDKMAQDYGNRLQDYVIENYNMDDVNELRRQAIVSL